MTITIIIIIVIISTSTINIDNNNNIIIITVVNELSEGLPLQRHGAGAEQQTTTH